MIFGKHCHIAIDVENNIILSIITFGFRVICRYH